MRKFTPKLLLGRDVLSFGRGNFASTYYLLSTAPKTGMGRIALSTVYCLLSTVLCVLSACGIYSMSSSSYAHIKTVAVPLFEISDDQSVEYGVIEQLTDVVIDGLVDDGSLRVVDEDRADSIIRGVVLRIKDEPFTYSAKEEAQSFRIRIFAQISYFDEKKDKVLWEEEVLEGWGTYSAESGDSEDEREEGKLAAMEMLAKDIIDRTASGW